MSCEIKRPPKCWHVSLLHSRCNSYHRKEGIFDTTVQQCSLWKMILFVSVRMSLLDYTAQEWSIQIEDTLSKKKNLKRISCFTGRHIIYAYVDHVQARQMMSHHTQFCCTRHTGPVGVQKSCAILLWAHSMHVSATVSDSFYPLKLILYKIPPNLWS